ncbi:MAG: DNA primase DnaG [Nitrososphaerales archaeon]
MPEPGIVKYLVKLKFDVEGVVEKADVIGAIFGQTEGLFGPEMNLNELQKSWKVGRIEISISSKNDKTSGEVLIPMSTDISTAALVAAAVESVDKVGPCSAHFTLVGIEDVRAAKKKLIVERAKQILREWASKTMSESEEIVRDVIESTKRARLISFGKEGLPAGPGVYTAEKIILVEGRADVINLLRAGFENVIALEGAKIPESLIRFIREKKVIPFLDGDRAGDLILRELEQVGANIERVIRAPRGKEVEELTPVEIIELLREEIKPVKHIQVEDAFTEKVKDLYNTLNGTLEAVILDDALNEVARMPVNELYTRLENASGYAHIVFDGIITQRLVDAASKIGVKTLIGHRLGELQNIPNGIKVNTFKDLGIE